MDEPDNDTAADADLLKEAKEQYKLCCEAQADAEKLWLEDVKFVRLDEQWPADVRRQRELEGRPCLTINKQKAMCRQVTNDARQNRPTIRTIPVDDDASLETSKILNGLIRNIEYASNADVAYDTGLEHAVYGSYGFWRVVTDYACNDTFDQDIKIERIPNPLTVKYDPYSTAADSSDWNVAFVAEPIRKEDFKKQWPKAKALGFDAEKEGKEPDWFGDNTITVAEWWKREKVAKTIYLLSDGAVMDVESYRNAQALLDVQGIEIVDERETMSYKVTQRIITGHEVLETNEWAGQYIPIVPVYGEEFIVEGKRHFMSLHRSARDAQIMFNYWRTASTELVALAPKAPYIGPKGAFDTDPNWDTANTKSHPKLEFDGNIMPQRQAFAGPPAGALQEALNAADDMKAIVGIYDASLGARSNETSGKAILARQREGDVSTFNFIDNQTRAITHTGRIIVDLIPKVYNTARIVRIMHEDGSNESVKINQPHPAEAPNQDGAQMGPQSGQMTATERKEQQEFAQGVIKLYDLTVGKYDVVCVAGPNYTTKRLEASENMLTFLQAFPAAAPVIGDLVAKNQDWPGAEEIVERLKTLALGNPQIQALQDQLKQQGAIIEQGKQLIANLQLQLKNKQGELAVKQEGVEIDRFKAQTDRMETQIKALAEQNQAAQNQMNAQIQGIRELLQRGQPQP